MADTIGTDALDHRIEQLRFDTPATSNLVHLNNAGASLSPQPVLDAVIDHLRLEARIGGYEAASEAADAADRVYRAGGALLGCDPSEVAFSISASDAWWRAFSSIRLVAGDRVLCGSSEYVSNAFALLQAKERGILVELIPDDDRGQIDLEALERSLDERVRLVALTHVPTSSGLVNPAQEVGVLTRSAGAVYLLDACQSAGQLPLDVEAIGCDFLSLTGRKFLRAPRGTGLLYAKGELLESLAPSPFIDGRSAQWVTPWEYRLEPTARRFEMFEVSYAAKIGFGVALDYALELGVDAIAERVGRLADALRGRLADRPGTVVHDPGRQRCGIVTFSVAGIGAAEIVHELRAKRINTSFATAESAQFDLGLRGVPEVVRASVHYFNTDEEIDRLIDALDTLGARKSRPRNAVRASPTLAE